MKLIILAVCVVIALFIWGIVYGGSEYRDNR